MQKMILPFSKSSSHIVRFSPLSALVLIALAVQTLASPLTVKGQELSARPVAVGLDVPWEVLAGPDAHLWVTERDGRILRVNPQDGTVLPITTISDVLPAGEAGLLGMQVLAGVANTLDVFLAYTYLENISLKLRIARYTYTPDEGSGTLTDPVVLVEGIEAAQNHDGCRLLLSPDNQHLYITTGDASSAPLSQNLNSLAGKTLRMNLDGSPALGNPNPNSLIWSYGHRNAQGLTWGRNNILYSSEHGHTTDDELNIIESNLNYGWPNVEGYCDQPFEQAYCDNNDVEVPILAWSPTLAPCGITYYDSDRIPSLKNSIIISFLKGRRLIAVHLSDDGRTVERTTDLFTQEYGRIRDVCVTPEGRLYFSTSNLDGRAFPNEIHEDGDRILEVFDPTTSVEENPDPGATTLSFRPNPTGASSVLHARTDRDGLYRMELFDALGQLQRTASLRASGGTIEWAWDGLDSRGVLVAPGAYFVVLTGQGRSLQATLVKQ